MDFEKVLKSSGIPTTSDDLKKRWNDILVENDTPITNNSEYSPFWRIVSALITAPAKWLIDLIISRYYPDMFLMTASGDALIKHAQGRGVDVLTATHASGQLVFSRIKTQGELQIPADEIIQTPPVNGIVYQTQLLQTLTFYDGESSAIGYVKATKTGADHNLAEGYFTVLKTAVPSVTVNNQADWLTQPGTDDESPESIRLRARLAFGSLAKFHIDAVYKSIIAAHAAISPDNIYMEHNAPRGPGTANAWLMLEAGNPSPEFIADINDYLNAKGNHGTGDGLLAFAMPESLHDIQVEYWSNTTIDDDEKATLLQNIEQFIRCVFRQNAAFECTKPRPRSAFSFSVLTQEIHNKFGTEFRIQFNLSQMINGLDLPRINSLTLVDNDV